MSGVILLLREQCEPLDEFMSIISFTNEEIQDSRAMEYYGRGCFIEGLLDRHQYIVENILYPVIDVTNPNQLYVRINKYHIEVYLK